MIEHSFELPLYEVEVVVRRVLDGIVYERIEVWSGRFWGIVEEFERVDGFFVGLALKYHLGPDDVIIIEDPCDELERWRRLNPDSLGDSEQAVWRCVISLLSSACREGHIVEVVSWE